MPPRLESRYEEISLRGIRYGVRHWGPEEAPRVFFLHGWMDSSPSFQFVVDALRQSWHIIAPDWRGYGGSQWLGQPYWFPDYYADLDALLAHYSPKDPVRLVGHSMGANIAATYAGLYPQRVAQLVMLDFLGLINTPREEAATRLALWIEQSREAPRLASYSGLAALADRLRKSNPRLNQQRAVFLAQHLSRRLADGRLQMACDPWHKLPSPHLYRVEDSMLAWQRIKAPVLMLIADQGLVQERFGNDPLEFERRLACFAQVRITDIHDSGHNVQHDQPEQIALALENFLQRN